MCKSVNLCPYVCISVSVCMWCEWCVRMVCVSVLHVVACVACVFVFLSVYGAFVSK